MPTDHNTPFNGFRIDTQIVDESIIQDTYRSHDGTIEHIVRSMMHTREQQVRDALIQLGWTPPGEARNQWLPIASAPKDGTEIIGYLNGDVRICSWEALDNPVAAEWGISGTWHRRNVRSGKELMGPGFYPTHWMPYTPPAQ